MMGETVSQIKHNVNKKLTRYCPVCQRQRVVADYILGIKAMLPVGKCGHLLDREK